MLTDAQYQMITASVDGVLPADQEPSFRQLLASSQEAKSIFLQLVAQSARLRGLRKLPAPAGLADRVMAQLKPIHVATPVVEPCPIRGVSWLPYAVAASLFLSLTAGSFWLASQQTDNPQNQLVERDSLPRAIQNSEIVGPQHVVVPPNRSVEIAAKPRPVDVKSPDVAVRPPVKTPEAAPAPRTNTTDVLGGALFNTPKLIQAEVRLPYLAQVADFERPEAITLLTEELSHDPAYRIDLFTRAPQRGIDAFQIAAKANGIAITVEAATQERIKNKVPTSFAIYTEALMGEEIGKLLAAVSANVRTTDPTTFGVAHVIPAKSDDHRELKELLGIDLAALLKQAKPAPASTTGKPVSSGTVGQVTAALKGKPIEKPAMLLTYLPPNARANPAVSKEVREFLARRGERKAGTVPVLFVIRPPAN